MYGLFLVLAVVAQSVEPQVVILVVAGSIPVNRPNLRIAQSLARPWWVFLCLMPTLAGIS